MSNNCLQRSNVSDTVYVGCSENDLLYGAKLGSIVRFALGQMNITDGHSGNPQQNYHAYCDAMGAKLGAGDPYDRERSFCSSSVAGVVSELKNVLPDPMHYLPHYEKMIQVVKDVSSSADSLSHVEHPGHLLFRFDSKEENDSYFSVIKIFHHGDDLELIPCLMRIRSKKSVGGVLIFRFSESSTTINYSQRKYCLTKYDIQAIIGKLQQKAHLKWN